MNKKITDKKKINNQKSTLFISVSGHRIFQIHVKIRNQLILKPFTRAAVYFFEKRAQKGQIF